MQRPPVVGKSAARGVHPGWRRPPPDPAGLHAQTQISNSKKSQQKSKIKNNRVRAIAWLSLYGFLDRLRCIVRRQGLLGPRTVQTSNAYLLRFPRGLFGFFPECHNCPP